MKKSFKKAGAAVLSMAMLLSMGAVSLPVYADEIIGNPTGATPGQVKVQISGITPGSYKQGEGTDTTSKDNDGLAGKDDDETTADGYRYDYLELNKITEATVTMYEIATFGQNGWNWARAAYETAALSAGLDDGNGNTDWQALYNKDNNNQFTIDSGTLRDLASALEQVKNAADIKGSATINYANGQTDVLLPSQSLPADTTGYYLLVTTTNQAGVIVQPVLISLKNGSNPQNVSLKGTTISVGKKIRTIKNKETNSDGDEWAVDGAVSSTGMSGVVGKNDVVHYELYARMPKYADSLSDTALDNFIFEDILDDGLTLDKDSIKVYLSTNDESGLTDAQRDISKTNNWYLEEGVGGDGDYSISQTDANDNPINGFRLIIESKQFNGTSTGTTSGTAISAANEEGNGTGQTKMENLYMVVSFDATIDEAEFNKGEMADYTYTSPEAALDATISADEKEQMLEILSGMPTRYQRRNVTYSNSALTTASGSDLKTLITTLGGSTLQTISSAAASLGYVKDGITDTTRAGADWNDVKTILTNATDGTPPGLNLAVTDDDVDNAYALLVANYIRKMIKLDYLNATKPIGEHNRAELTYANNYSTGKGEAKMPTGVTTVYSVDVDFTKYAQTLKLTALNDTTAYNLDNLLAFMQAVYGTTDAGTDAEKQAAALAKVRAVNPDITNAEDLATGELDKVKTALGATATEADAKMAKALLDAYQKAQTAKYLAEAGDQFVEGAVFALYKNYGAGAKNKEFLGYAVSNSSGQLMLLEADENNPQAAEPTSAQAGTATGKVAYCVSDGNGGYNWYKVTTKRAWTTLTTGDYDLEEVSVPAGYKKWDSAASFTITSPQNAGTNEYTGVYHASGAGTAYNADGTNGTQNFDETKEAPSTGNANLGKYVLSADIYNEPQDKLPATGGMGTVLFTAGGISVVLIAGALFVMYMKKRNSEEE